MKNTLLSTLQNKVSAVVEHIGKDRMGSMLVRFGSLALIIILVGVVARIVSVSAS